MTALPVLPRRPLTVADYEALPEDEQHRWELLEGNLVIAPSPSVDHAEAMGNLYEQLKRQCPSDVVVLQDIDVDLQLAPPDGPGSVRRPDLVVVDQAERDRVRVEGGILRASGVRLIVEIVSPGSIRTDRIIKHAEYADAGIPCYWILDLESPVSLVAYRLAGELGYVEDGEATGTFTTTEPYPLTIALDRLV
ncbi:MAG TPA: Uma2 family endonuclease [Jatrophihabitantaceae bacterium]